MPSNWIIDRLLVVGIVVLVVGALHVVPQLGFSGVATRAAASQLWSQP